MACRSDEDVDHADLLDGIVGNKDEDDDAALADVNATQLETGM